MKEENKKIKNNKKESTIELIWIEPVTPATAANPATRPIKAHLHLSRSKMSGSLHTRFYFMKHLPDGMHTGHVHCICENMQIYEYEIYKYDKMIRWEYDKMIRWQKERGKEENKKIRK
jgi:hypothetical protein